MLGYKLLKVEKPPTEAWAEMKETANKLAASLCETWREICQATKKACGQEPYMAILPEASIGRTQLCVHVTEAYVWLPRSAGEHWDFKASQIREAIEKMASLTRERLQQAADEALEQ